MRTALAQEAKSRASVVSVRERSRVSPMAKLAIGSPGDRFEQEADQVADAVMLGSAAPITGAAPSSVQRACAGCSREDETIRGKAQQGALNGNANTVDQIASARTGGAPLDAPARTFFEPRFGRDFSDVRIHAGSEAHALSGSLGARAFTVGNHIFFDRSEYAPATEAGRRLLAHELTHVVQQRGGAERVQMQTKTAWGVDYKTKKEAQVQVDRLRALGLHVYEPEKAGKNYTFSFDLLTKAEAEAEAKAKADPKHETTVVQEPHSKGWYVHQTLKCPEGLPAKSGYQTWDTCFAKESQARALVAKFTAAHIPAEVSPQQPNHQFGVYYAPLTKADAQKAADTDLAKRLDKTSPMYKTNVTQNTDLKSYTYDIDASCPPGYDDLGTFRLTVYPLANEKEFTKGSSDKDPCGLKGTFNHNFLFRTDKAPRGVKMEGTGIAKNGDIIHYKGNDCFEVVKKIIGSSNRELVPMKSVAVDTNKIKMGSELMIESFGAARADDGGSMVNGDHIDLYYGLTVTGTEAEQLTRNGKVCKKQ